MAAEKARLRGVFRQRRAALGPEARAAQSVRICAHLGAWLREHGAETAGPLAVSAFWPLAEEPDLRPLLRALHDGGVRVALPVVASAPDEAPRLEHRAFAGEAALVPSRFGVMEPLAGHPLPPEAIGVALVPALAVDASGVRLGYGGGFYDAFLATTAARRVGVVFASGAARGLPAEPHDARLEAICTPDGLRAAAARGPGRRNRSPGPA